MVNRLASREQSYQYSQAVEKPFGELDAVLTWCKQELQDQWAWKLLRTSSDILPGQYVFYFRSEQDFFWFTMRWS